MVAVQGLAVTRHGTSNNTTTPTLVLMHFLGGSQREWDEVLPLLGPDQLSVTLDMPGFGGSADISGYTVAEMADSVEATIRELNLKHYILVGHSMSGKVAAVVARRAQDREDRNLTGLVLIAPSPPSPEPMTEEKREGMIASLGHRHEGDFARACKYITRNEERDISRDVEHRAAHEVLRMNRNAWVAWLTGGSKEDWTERVGLLTMPALVIAGENDASLGPDSQRKFTLPHLANGRIEVVEGCSHLVPMERPSQLATLLSNFVRSLIR